MTATQPAGRGGRRFNYWYVAYALAVIALVAGALLAAMLRQGGVSEAPSASPSLSQAPSVSAAIPTPDPSPSVEASQTPLPGPDDVLPVASRVQVLAAGLRLREFPRLDGAVLTRLAAGEVVYVVDTGGSQLPPTFDDGYAWYPVQFISGYADWPADPPTDTAAFGYVAGHSADGERLVELMEPRCPSSADIVSLTRITAWERASCMGDRQLTLEGTYGCGVCDSLVYEGTWEPEWLASYLNPLSPLSPVGQVQAVGVEPIVLAFPPAVGKPESGVSGSVMRIVGHFNDPRSTDCVVGDESGLSEESAAEWYCRERFVVDEWEITGTDPDYPTPP